MSEVILTKEQQAVVDNRGGTLLVSAAAGSGKTKVLLDRVLKRVEEERCNLDDFLMITFTKPAAAELRGKLLARLSELLSADPDNRHLQKQMSRVYLAQISTVHAFCGSLLREYAHQVGLAADFRVCDEEESALLRERAMTAVLDNAYEDLSADPEVTSALNFLGGGRNDAVLPQYISKVYSGVQCYKSPEGRMAELRSGLELSQTQDVGQTVWGQYLMEEFHTTLVEYERMLEDALVLIDRTEALQPYRTTFGENLELIRRFSAAEDWEAIRSIPVDPGKLRAIRNCPEPELQKRVQKTRKRVIDGLRAQLERFRLSSAEALADLEVNSSALRGLLTLTERFARSYAKEKENRHLVDYNDLEHKTLKLLLHADGTPTAAAREIGGRFVEIMVDEYQDTNGVQDAIFNALSRSGENLFFVGDVKQSIYRFRLADPTIFLEKYRTYQDYTQAEAGIPRKILLSDNFRSHPEILAAANDVFRMTMTERVGGLRYGDAEALRARRIMPDMGAPAVELHCIDTESVPRHPPVERDEIEAEFIARRIDRMLREGEQIPDGDGLRPIHPEDIVILVRAVQNKGEIYGRALQRYGLRCVCGSENIFSSEEITVLLALLQVIDNPHQDVPLLTVLLSPLFCVSSDLLAQARSTSREGDLFDAISAAQGFDTFLDFLQEMRQRSGTVGLRELLDTVEEQLFLRAVFGAMDNGSQRIRNLDSFFTLADSYETGGRFGLPGFLRYLDSLRQKGLKSETAAAPGAVRLMTIHKSKGLEFPVVFLADLCKRFNREDAAAPLLIDNRLGIGASCYDPVQHIAYPTVARHAISRRILAEGISEEMRVLYVAMTRPQYRLVMTCCAARLAGTLKSIAQELTSTVSNELIESAASMGHWVLMTALTRTEAGELFQAAETPDFRQVSQYPWRITWNEGADFLLGEGALPHPVETAETPEAITFSPLPLPHRAAQKVPSKVTATQLKGRSLDNEVSTGTVRMPTLNFQKPQFGAVHGLTPTERGTAIHLAMQYLRYEACTDAAGVSAELDRLEQEKFLTPQQRQAVPPKKILRFFESPLGRRVRGAKELVREFKFSVLEDGSLLDESLAGEEILLQGVTDCCILEEDGLVIIDFKSDDLRPGSEAQRGEHYRGQLDAYSRALSQVFSRPVKERILYFFATDRELSL